MGTTARVLLTGADPGIAAGVRARIEALEERWSRFRPTSDVAMVNTSSGSPVPVHAETLDLVERAIAWHRATAGRFDPTVGAALVAAGYDRDRATGHGPIGEPVPAPGCDGIVVDRDAGTVCVPRGTSLDLGGIGKGRAVDLLAEQLGVLPGGLVDLGGDLRVWGDRPSGEGWPIAIEDGRDGSQLALLGLADGAVATSSVLRRRWAHGDKVAHHLIDPASGAPAAGEIVAVSVVAGSAEAAEVLAKAAVIAGAVDQARALLEGAGVAAVIVPTQGPPTLVGPFTDLCWIAPQEAA